MDIVVVGSFHQDAGGKGANQAVAAARLGARVAFVGAIGNDAPRDEILRRFAVEGVETHVTHGANALLTPEHIDAAADLIRGARVLLAQLEPPVGTIAHAIALASAAGVQVVLDPAPPSPIDDETMSRIDVIRSNSDAAAALTGIEVHDRDSARRAAEVFLRHGVRLAAVQAGEEGNLLLNREEEIWLPNIPVERVDTTGGGDVFAAAFAVALIEGRTPAQAGCFASAAAALEAMPYRQQVDAFVAERGSAICTHFRVR